jgi:hypothetical protein
MLGFRKSKRAKELAKTERAAVLSRVLFYFPRLAASCSLLQPRRCSVLRFGVVALLAIVVEEISVSGQRFRLKSIVGSGTPFAPGPVTCVSRAAFGTKKETAMATASTIDSAQREPLWTVTAKMPSFPPLNENLHADVCVVGAGIAGLTTAYLLTEAGKRVVVLDDGPLAGGMSSATTAHLSNAIDDSSFEIERIHGHEGARLAVASHTAAIHRIEAIVQKEKIQCDFERLSGYLFLPPGESEVLLDPELAAAHNSGLSDVEKIARVPWPDFDTGPCLRFPNQGQFHPLKYLAGLAKAIDRDGGRLFTKSHADEIKGGAPARIKVGRHEVTADAVVVATNVPVNDLLAIHTKQAPYMTYVIGAQVPRGPVQKALYWDTEDPYHYIRLQSCTSVDQELVMLLVGV